MSGPVTVETRARGSWPWAGRPGPGSLPDRVAGGAGKWAGKPSAPISAPLPLSPGGVVVYAFRLDAPERELALCQSVLTPGELRHASRFVREQLCRRWVVARGTLRMILGAYLEAKPGAVVFSCGRFGKPALAGNYSHAGLEFNLSHSEDVALLAVSHGLTVGVDVEIVRFLEEFDQLVERFFSPREAAAFGRLAAKDKPVAFFNLWTRKEAWLKATGEGIGQFLNRVEVNFLPGEPARLRQWPRLPGLGSDWRLAELHPAPGYAAALAVGAREFQLQLKHI